MPEPLVVVEWTHYEDNRRPENSLGGFGGWVDGHSFEEYLAGVSDDAKPYALALRDAVVSGGIRITGYEHQYKDDGVPVFSDGTTACFTFRAWGDIMAAIWNSEENTRKYCYMSFYM